MESVKIRKALLKDLAILQKIGRETFYETFAPHNKEEQIRQYLKESFADDKLMRELNNPSSVFFMAWEYEEPISYLKLNSGKAQTEIRDESSLEIERIYVKASHQRKNIGQLLYHQALETAADLGKSFLWLGVWEQNTKAIHFYRKNGFEVFDKHIFRLGHEEQTDLMMKKRLDGH